MSKTALITGITGQDGSYLAELLLKKRYRIYGIVQECDREGLQRLACRNQSTLLKGDMRDQHSIDSAVKKSRPDEVYHLAAPTFVQSSVRDPVATTDIIALGTLRLTEAVRKYAPSAHVFLASSAEVFGGTDVSPQNEETALCPRTPYGIAKAHALMSSRFVRENHSTFISNGIFYNHESPRRPPEFVTRKISLGVARIALDLQNVIDLGDLKARRDWGYAPEYVEAAWRTLQAKKPEDFVLATGELHSVSEFLEEACKVAGLSDPRKIVNVRNDLIRPHDTTLLRGDASKARRVLGWTPKVGFRDLVKKMVEADLCFAATEAKQKKRPSLRGA